MDIHKFTTLLIFLHLTGVFLYAFEFHGHKTPNNDVYLQLWLFPRGLISGQQQVCKYGKNIFNINISKKTRGGGKYRT